MANSTVHRIVRFITQEWNVNDEIPQRLMDWDLGELESGQGFCVIFLSIYFSLFVGIGFLWKQ